MRNFRQRGETIVVPAPAPGVLSGAGVLVGGLFGVAVTDAATGVAVPVLTEGMFNLPKVAGTAWNVGDKLYWDNAAKNVTTVSAGNTRIGVAGVAALVADVLGDVAVGVLY